MRPLPITGYSLLNAIGCGVKQVKHALEHGQSGLTDPHLKLPFETAVGSVAEEPPPLDGDLASWDTRMGRFAAYLVRDLEAPITKLRQKYAADRIGILLGTSTAGAEATEAAYREYLEQGSLPKSYDFWHQHTYGALLHIIRKLTGIEGPGWMVSTACSSSAKPMASAHRLIQSGVIDAALVGGVDTLCHMTVRGFMALSALSTKPCQPFNSDIDGISIGEAGALVVVDKTGDALAFVEGTGESSDAYHISAPHPKGEGAELAMQRAMDGVCTPKDIDHVNAHGTGTPLNDQAESQAIVRLLGKDVPVISTKGYTGHTLGAAGATEIVLALLMMQEGFIAPSIGAKPNDPKIEANVVYEKTSAPLKRVLTNSFAFGGNNISVLLRSA